jgi:hypothetical protein
MPTPDAPLSPADVLPDGQEGAAFNGTYVRKGSVGAFLANARGYAAAEPGGAERAAFAERLRELRPALEAIGLFEVFAPRDAELAALLGE